MNETAGQAGPRSVIVSIQTLRGLAALGVIMHHQLQGVVLGAKFGQYGVDLFFVISGFIMTCLADSGPVTPSRFVLDRLCRIVPTYWAATAMTVALFHLGIFDPRVVAPDPWHLLWSLAFIPHPHPSGELWPTLFLGWTLNFEMFFYAVFALLLLLPARLRLGALATVLLVLVLLGRVWPDKGPFALFYTDPRLVEFLAGAVLGDAFGLTLRRRSEGAALTQAGLAVAGLALVVLVTGQVAAGIAATILVAGGVTLERRGAFPIWSPLLLLGSASYSIYLFQQVAFDLSDAVFAQLGPHGITLPARLHLERWTAALAALMFGLLCHFWIERPLTNAARSVAARWAGQRPRLAPPQADLPLSR